MARLDECVNSLLKLLLLLFLVLSMLVVCSFERDKRVTFAVTLGLCEGLLLVDFLQFALEEFHSSSEVGLRFF